MSALKNKWQSYVGPNDERQLTEIYKIRNKGFIALLVCVLAVGYYMMSLSAALSEKMYDLANQGTTLDFNLPSLLSVPAELLLLCLVVICIVMTVDAARKGISETNRFGDVDKFPWGYYALWSAGAGIVAALVLVLGRMAAYWQVFGALVEPAAFLAGFAVGLFVSIFILCMLAFFLVFKSAKSRREKLEAELDMED